MASHTVYAVASGKGGVGKTVTTVNLGASLAAAGYEVAIVDTDLGMANLGGFIGVEPEQTLHEVLSGDASLEEATYRALNGLAVVPSGISLNGFANVETAALSDAVGALRDAFDYVLLDLGAGLSHDTVLPLALADAVVLVSTPQPVSVQDTAKTRQITERLGGQVAGVVLTRAGGAADLSLEEISDTLELPILAVIPEDDAVPASAREGKAVLQYDEDSPTVEGYHGLARIIEEESLEAAPVVPEMPERETDAEAAAEPASEPEPADGGGVEAAERADDAERAEAAPDGAAAAPPDAAATEEPVGDPGTGEAATDDPETTAAEIAAAIEDAASVSSGRAGGAGSAEAEQGSEPALDSEPEPEASESASASGAETTGESTAGADDPTESEAPEAADEAAEAEDGEPEALKVESGEASDTEEAEAVDQLFSVEGADPEDLDEDDGEESSGGLLSRFLG